MLVDIVFISAATLGAYALRGIIDSPAFRSGEATIKAIFSLADERCQHVIGYHCFDGMAKDIGAAHHKVSSIKTSSVVKQISAYQPDLICIVAWSELAPARLLDIPKEKHEADTRHGAGYGCIGIHPMLLPQGRGRAPIPWAIIKGLHKSGVTLFYLEDGADAGDIIAQRECAILFEDDASTLYTKAATLHYEIMKETLPLLVNNTAARIPQRPDEATIWQKRRPEDGFIHWDWPTMNIYNLIRALTPPYPGAFTLWHGSKLTIWKARLLSYSTGQERPGTIVDLLDNGIVVAGVDGLLSLEKMQFAGEPVLDANSFVERHGLLRGETFS